MLDLNEDDLRPFKVGGEGTGTVLDLPIVTPGLPAAPGGPQIPPAQQPAPAAPGGPVQPLLPPPPTPVRP